ISRSGSPGRPCRGPPSFINSLSGTSSRDHSSCRGYNVPGMKYFYGEFDGQEFPTPDKLFGFDQLMQFILQYGDQALKAIQQMMGNPKDPEQSELLEQMLKEGMLDKDGKGKVRLTPKAVTRMQRKALIEVFANL